jgi:hypothetical protein
MRSPSTIVATLIVLTVALQPLSATDEAPRTADGKPDLSGTYNVATLTPLQRPGKFGDNLYLTREQAEEIEAAEQALQTKGLERSNPDREAPAVGGAAPVGFKDSQREDLGAGNVGGYNSFWIDRGDEVFSIDGKMRTSIITKPVNGRQPRMTREGMMRMRKAFASFAPNSGTAWWLDKEGPGPYDDIEQLPLSERCLLGFGSTQGPPMMPVLYNNHKQIVQTPEYVMILVEMIHDARIIRLDSEHGSAENRKWLGDSIGWWEGDTLVVDTINFRDGRTGLTGASKDLHVIERFTRLDADTLHYEFEVDDPNTWPTPWKGDYVWPGTDNKVYEYACHEGNYSLGGIMRGARVLEADVEGSGGE